jgi:hypothetical protein
MTKNKYCYQPTVEQATAPFLITNIPLKHSLRIFDLELKRRLDSKA